MSKQLALAILRQIIMRMHNRLSIRLISRQLNLNRKTVDKYVKIIEDLKLDLASLMELDDRGLYEAIHGKKNDLIGDMAKRKKDLIDYIPYFAKELERTGVTLKLLWKEYFVDNKEKSPYGYPSFCRILRPGLKSTKTSYHKRYAPGEILMIDFAGDKVYYVDKSTGEMIACVVYVGVLGYSNYVYAEVLPSAQLPYLIEAMNNNLKFIQGVPITVLSDNMAQLVSRANRYEPKFTTTVIDWANHNRTAIEACTVASPRQKSPVEGHVKLVYQGVFAPLRDLVFFSLKEIKEAFAKRIIEFNEQNFQGRTYSRATQFLTEELPKLQPLPEAPFEMKFFKTAKVQKNYHVMLGEERHFYSVPVSYVGESVQIVYNTKTVEIYHQMTRIATHQRNSTRYGYTTIKEHMPSNDKHYDKTLGYRKQDFIDQATLVGENTRQYIEAMINNRTHEQHAYNGCLGVLRLGTSEKYGPARLEKACGIGIQLQKFSYKVIAEILEKSIDQRPNDDDDDDSPWDEHGNLHGPLAF